MAVCCVNTPVADPTVDVCRCNPSDCNCLLPPLHHVCRPVAAQVQLPQRLPPVLLLQNCPAALAAPAAKPLDGNEYKTTANRHPLRKLPSAHVCGSNVMLAIQDIQSGDALLAATSTVQVARCCKPAG